MKRTTFSPRLAVLLAVGLSGALLATAQNPPSTTPTPAAPAPTGGPDRQRGERPERGDRGDRANFQRGAIGGIGLDEKQRELYREASEKNREALTQLDEKLRTAQQELLKAVLAENYDDKLVREKADAVAKIQSDMTVLRAKALSTVAPTLKPEQREQLETSRMGAAMLSGGGMGGFGGGPGGPGGFGGGGAGGAAGDGGRRGRDGQTGFEQGPTDRGNRPPGTDGRRRPQ